MTAVASRREGRSRDWRTVRLVSLDLETTTADPRMAVPLSAGWVAVDAGRVLLETADYRLLRHEGDLPAAGVSIHNLLPDDLSEGEDPAVVARELAGVLDGAVLVAHGADLERAVLGRWGVGVPESLDTLAMVRRIDEREGRPEADARLAAAAARYGVPSLPAHHAFRDALSAALLLVTLVGRLEQQRGSVSLADLRALGR